MSTAPQPHDRTTGEPQRLNENTLNQAFAGLGFSTDPERPVRLFKTDAERDAAWREHQLARRGHEDFADRWRNSQVPSLHARRIEADDLRGEEWNAARAGLREGMTNPDGSILSLVGNRGAGKTQLAAAALHDFARRTGRTIRYARVMDILVDIKGTYRDGSKEGERDVLKRYAAPSALVIDGMEERAETEWETRMLTHIIDTRYGERRHTVLVANLAADALERSLGPSIADRMLQTGGLIECVWPSFRAVL